MTTPDTALPPGKAGRREWIGLAVLTLACLLYVVAQEAFVEGMQVAATISAVLAVAIAILSLLTLRDVRMGGSDPDDGELDAPVEAPYAERPSPRTTTTPVPEA